jgi:hypothetical protein
MDRVAATLQRHPLIELWVNALLNTEGRSLGGYRGLVPDRAPTDCAFAIESIMRPEDLDLLVRAYQAAENRTTRITLMRFIEGLTLERFVVVPKGSGRSWGPEVYDRGFDALDAAIRRWTASGCVVDFQRVVSEQLAKMGLEGVDPLDPGSCEVWQRVLAGGDPGWWPLAARRLYECGGPWVPLSVVWAESDANRDARNSLLKWYGLAGTDVRRPIKRRPR